MEKNLGGNQILAFVICMISLQTYGQVTPLINGHAHNDYVHPHPLTTALQNGFTSIEVDVFLHNQSLVVSHIAVGLNHKRTIGELYLHPLSEIIKQNSGTVYLNTITPVVLMIDFKTAAEPTYQKLLELLKPYHHLITLYKGDSVIKQGAINILLSGRTPAAALLKTDTAWATLDGSVSSIADTLHRRVTTRYSSAWQSHFSWNGIGKMPKLQKKKLKYLVGEAHRLGKQIRFYHIPDKPNCWRVLLNAGVDWINTNRLSQFKNYFLNEYRR